MYRLQINVMKAKFDPAMFEDLVTIVTDIAKELNSVILVRGRFTDDAPPMIKFYLYHEDTNVIEEAKKKAIRLLAEWKAKYDLADSVARVNVKEVERVPEK